MKDIDYYIAYRCLEQLVLKKKITPNVANKILKEYEKEFTPTFKHFFKK